MIHYALICDSDHAFDGWFASSDDFDAQQARGLLSCPACGSAEVRKQIMAPAVRDSRKREAASPARRSMMMEAMSQVRAHVEATFDYVGDTFAAEARKIHQGEAEARGIYGEASGEDVRALVRDGVPVAPLPPKPPRKTEVN